MWRIDGTRIFVQDYKENENQIIPRLQPLAGGTVLQIFGNESPITHITGLVVSMNDKEELKAMISDGVAHILTGPYSISGSYYVKGVTATMLPATLQTIRPDLDCEEPVFNIEMEIYDA